MTQLTETAATGAMVRARARASSAVSGQPLWVRTVASAVLMAFLLVALLMAVAPMAMADTNNDDTKDYSLYNLASNAAVYFSEKASPEQDGEGLTKEGWKSVATNPAQAGSLLGYADDEGFLKWMFSTFSGSSQTVKYEAFDATGATGMKEYGYFGAANADLGFDSTTSSAGFDSMIHAAGGSLIWLFYILAMGVSLMFWLFIQILKLFNPFLWFHQGMSAVSPAYGTWADGMVTGSSGINSTPDGLAGLSSFISQWYSTLISMSWGVLVPLFIGFLLISLVFFKKMDRGAAIKKLVVRIVFIGVGLPLVGGMYTSILDQFDDSLLTQSAGPTRVVLSTYVDFDGWLNVNRLQVPSDNAVTWDPTTGHAQPSSVFKTRNTAMDINAGTGRYPGITPGGAATPQLEIGSPETDGNAVLATIGLLNRYIAGDTVNPSDFETNIQAAVTNAGDVSWDDKKDWFTGDDYDDPDKFGEGSLSPTEHPIIATNGGGLTATPLGAGVGFSSSNNNARCGHAVVQPNSGGRPADCNLSPLAAYNYLNTEFSSDAMTIYSSNKVTSGFTRSFHASVSQVGTGPAGFMYWANTLVLLASITMIGIAYGLGMLVASLKRTFGMVAAVPFATLGVMSGIAKVIIYAVAMILEVLVTLFLYQFVSEFLVSVPQIVEGPIAKLTSSNPTGTDRGIANIFSNPAMGVIAVVFMTIVSILLIIGVTIALLKVRSSVLKALDEAVTKLVDKFLETNTPPKAGGGLLPAMAGGLGAGAGMAASRGMIDKLGGGGLKSGAAPQVGSPGQTGGGTSKSGSASTNAGGTNGSLAVGAGKPAAGELMQGPGQTAELEARGGPAAPAPGGGSPSGGAGGPGGADGAAGLDGASTPGGAGGPGGADGKGGAAGPGGADGKSKTGRSASQVGDSGTSVASSGRKSAPGRQAQDDRALAQSLDQQGGLTQLGVGGGSRMGRGAGGQGHGSTPPVTPRDLGGANGSVPSGSGTRGANDQPRPGSGGRVRPQDGSTGQGAPQPVGGTGGSGAQPQPQQSPSGKQVRPPENRSSTQPPQPQQQSPWRKPVKLPENGSPTPPSNWNWPSPTAPQPQPKQQPMQPQHPKESPWRKPVKLPENGWPTPPSNPNWPAPTPPQPQPVQPETREPRRRR